MKWRVHAGYDCFAVLQPLYWNLVFMIAPPTQPREMQHTDGNSDRALLRSTSSFAQESPARSWWHLLSTFALFLGLLVLIAHDLPWWSRLPLSLLAGLFVVRMFVIYHDYQHDAILRRSVLARGFMAFYGMLTLSPPSAWRRSHNYHHKNNAKFFATNVGSYPLMTVAEYRKAGWGKRVSYAASRHPLTILFGCLTVFLYGMCLRPFFAHPRQHFDCALAILLQAGIVVGLAVLAPVALLYVYVIPHFVGSAIGAYLFYAQHNYPGVKHQKRENWRYVFSAMQTSSFMDCNAVMHWFTANIGFHHVHHLNPRIPFYRLPEAMEEIPELRYPVRTSLLPADVFRCLRLKLWDPEKDRMVTFREGVAG